MLRTLRFRLLVVSIVAVLAATVLPSFIQAAEGEEPRINNLVISIWPEYDDPRVLVIYAGHFAPDSPVPSEAKLRVPKGAQINSACSIEPDGTHHPQSYQIVDAGEFAELTFELLHSSFHVEYYHAGIEGQTDKVISFLGQLLYPVDNLEIDVLQPLKASNFKVSPDPLTVQTDADGFKHHRVNLGTVPKEQLIELTVTYTKTDPDPSLTTLNESTSNPRKVVIIVVIGGAVLLGVVGYWVVSGRRQTKYALATGGRKQVRGGGAVKQSPRAKPHKIDRATSEARFCTSCGAKLPEDASFCSKCGQARRNE